METSFNNASSGGRAQGVLEGLGLPKVAIDGLAPLVQVKKTNPGRDGDREETIILCSLESVGRDSVFYTFSGP